MCLIIRQIELEYLELFALRFEKLLNPTFFYTLASVNIDQPAQNLVKRYAIMRSLISSIMDFIGPELSELSALEFVKIAESDFFYTLASANVDQLVPNMVTIYMTMRSWMSSIMGQIRQQYLESFDLE